MSRKNIFDVLSKTYNAEKEIMKLEGLLTEPKIRRESEYMIYVTHSIYEWVDEIFHDWDAVNTVLNCDEFKERVGINYTLTKLYQNQTLEHHEVIAYLEFAYNILHLFDSFIVSKDRIESGEQIYINAKKVCEALISHLNLKEIEIPDKDAYELVVAEPLAIQVAETVPEELSIQTLRYHHHLLKGDLTAKRNILLNIGLHIEGEGIRKKLKGNNFERLDRDIGFFLNRVNIRHANSDQKVSDLSNEELEKWYDRAYDLFLLGIATTNYIDIRPEIKKFSKFLDDVKED